MKIPIGRPEKTFALVLLAYLALSFLPVPGPIALVITLAVCVAGAWVFVRLSRRVVRELLWRLRNRLIVAYVFIALVPVVLITLLAGLGAFLVGGQLCIYLVTSELDRRTTNLRSAIEYLVNENAASTDWVYNVAPYLGSRFPGLQIIIQDASGTHVVPAGGVPTLLPSGWPQGSGLAVRDNVLYGWAHAQSGRRTASAMFPLTREYLGHLAPDLCESAIMDWDTRRILLHASLPDDPPTHNRVPPAVNRIDYEIRWGTPIPVYLWDVPRRTANEWFTVRTRPSAILRTVFEQKVERATDLVTIVFFTVAVLFLVAEIVALVIGVSLTRTITAAIHNLYEGTLRVRGGDFSHRIPIRGKDQLAEVGVSFNEMTSNVERLLTVEKERERLHSELEIAREVQNQLYPKSVPDCETIRLTAACSPARIVSGDYYDYQQIDRERVAIAIGDVAGKGISAALLMATIQSSFRSQIRGSLDLAVTSSDGSTCASVSTSSLVSHLNKQLYADTAPEKYATFYLGVYDEPSSVLTYTNAGHLPPILVSGGVGRRLEVNGMVVGAFPFANYGESQVQLAPGDLVVFFTDGISEPEDAYGEQFGEDRLVDLVLKNVHLDDEEIIECILHSVREWTGSDELQDDMTLLLVRRR